MQQYKRWFPLIWLLLLAVGIIHAAAALISQGLSYSWLAALTGCLAVVLVLGTVAVSGQARTAENLPLLHMLAAAAPALILLDLLKGNPVSPWPLLYAVVIAYGGTLLYLRWYARFNRKASAAIQPGAEIPEFHVTTLEGETLSHKQLIANKPTVLMFIRGNWCPLCTAQVKELAADYQQLVEAGAQAWIISPQPAEKTGRLAQRFNVPLNFAVDKNNAAAKALGIFDMGGAPAGTELLGHSADVAYPTTIIVNAAGRILYCDQTDNYRLRPEPTEFLRVINVTRR